MRFDDRLVGRAGLLQAERDSITRLLAVLEAARVRHGNDVDDNGCPLCAAVHACDADPLLAEAAPLANTEA